MRGFPGDAYPRETLLCQVTGATMRSGPSLQLKPRLLSPPPALGEGLMKPVGLS